MPCVICRSKGEVSNLATDTPQLRRQTTSFQTWPGLSVVIVGALVLGYGLYVLLRTLQV
jgi:hypothetical protein